MAQPLAAEILPQTSVAPLFVRWIKFDIKDLSGQVHHFECQVTQAAIGSTGGTPQSINTLCPDGAFSENAERTWQLTVTGVQDVETAESLMLFLLEHDGERATVTYFPKVTQSGQPVGRGWRGTVTLSPPDNIGGAASGNYATFQAVLPYSGKPDMVDTQGNVVIPPETPRPATGATPGSPGMWTPVPAIAPPTMATAPLLVPPNATAWAADQYINTAESGPGSEITWDGAAWIVYAGPHKGAASPGNAFPSETQITASDATNALKLSALGYMAVPQTPWTTTQKITVATFDFNWDGSAWDPGAAP